MVGRIEGRTAIIVGAGQTPGETIGNGRAMALLFAREGAHVWCADISLESAEETAHLVTEAGGQASAIQVDVSRSADCARLIEQVQAHSGSIDILVNNVGIGADDAPAHAIEEEVFDRILATNLKSMAMTIRHALPLMRAQRSGAILNISSVASLGGHSMLAYEVSKAGVNRLTLSVALSNARYGVRCNAILPGLMDTPMAIEGHSKARDVTPESLRQERHKRVPMGHMGTGWDTAKAAVFLCSSDAEFITGVMLPVDGGMSARIG